MLQRFLAMHPHRFAERSYRWSTAGIGTTNIEAEARTRDATTTVPLENTTCNFPHPSLLLPFSARRCESPVRAIVSPPARESGSSDVAA